MNTIKNTMLKFMAVFAILCATITSCTDAGTIIGIISPANSQIFETGSMMNLRINVNNSDGLGSVTINVTSKDLSTPNVLGNWVYNNPGTAFSLDTMVMAMTPDHSDYLLTVTAVDLDGNSSTDNLTFHIHPGGGHHHGGGDTTLPHIHIMMPHHHDTLYNSGDTVNVHAHAYSDTTVKKIVATIMQHGSSTPVWADSMVNTTDTLHIMGMYILPTITGMTHYHLKVEAHDSEGRHRDEEFNFMAMP